jgi:hypothetical protein
LAAGFGVVFGINIYPILRDSKIMQKHTMIAIIAMTTLFMNVYYKVI